MNYIDFLKQKIDIAESCGFDTDRNMLNSKLYDFQKDIVKWALKKGRAAIFADCGLGKTAMQLEFAYKVFEKTGKPVLILAPLAVAAQTYREGQKFGIDVTICESQNDVCGGVNITNYPNDIVLDPFGGIGSSAYMAIRMGRRAVSIELKESYYNAMRINCANAEKETKIGAFDTDNQITLFDLLESEVEKDAV